jgi:adenylate cyclase
MFKELTRYKILVVDDETANLRLLERLFRSNYEVVTAASGQDALDLLSVHDFSLIISDQRMPGMTGIEFLKKASEMRPQTVRIMLTGYSDAEALVEAINSGAVYKYITKPWVNEELLQTARRALQHYETMRAQRQLQITNERMQLRLKSMKDAMVRLAGEVVHNRNSISAERAEAMRDRAIQVGRGLSLVAAEIETLGTAAYFYEVSANMPTIGSLLEVGHDRAAGSVERCLSILAEVPELEDVFTLLQFRSEHFDGTGAPNGFMGDEIPVPARILSVVHEYARLASRGNGLRDLTDDEITDHLLSLAGTQFDPEIVDAVCGRDDIRMPANVMADQMFAQ